MVEFGLKLEDNKVLRWSEHYIDYEKLKAILAKCKAANQRLDELVQRKPELAATLLKSMSDDDGKTPQDIAPNYGSMSDISAATESLPSKDEKATTEGQQQGSSGELNRVDSKGKLFLLGLSQTMRISEFFIRNYEKSLKEAARDTKVNADEFQRVLEENVARVQAFARKKLKELHGRVDHLRDSAETLKLTNAPVMPLAVAQRAGNKIWSALTKVVNHHHKPKSGDPEDEASLLETALHSQDDDDDDVGVETTKETNEKSNSVRKREVESIQRALEDIYRSAKLLQNFCIMNYTGFVKIIKKHDKLIKSRKGKLKVTEEDFPTTDLDELTATMEKLYANWFCDENVAEARAQMLTKRGDGLEMDWSQLRLGYRMGMCTVLGLWVCWDCIWGMLSNGMTTIGGRTAFPVFRATGGLLMLQWCWGGSVWVWTRYRVNYIYLFDLNPSTVADPLTIFHEAVNNTLVYFLSMLLYYKAGANEIPFPFPAGIFPFLLVMYTTSKLMLPWRIRGPMWNSIWHVVTSPATSPTFFHGYVGDIFTSLVKVFQDLAWTFFFVIRGDWLIPEDLKASQKHSWSKALWYTDILIPLLTLLPLWFRFNQCLRRYADSGKRFPHLANAFKYALSQTVTLFGAFHPLYMRNYTESSNVFQDFWTFAFVSSSLYSFWWDLNMDWGLGNPKYGFLGPRLMYPKRSFYFGIIGLDFVLRFAWVLTLLPPQSGAQFALPAYLSLVSMMFEIFRRTIWGFLRLENEHRSNTAGYRRVDFVPLHFRTGHDHSYKNQAERRGSYVLMEVMLITLLVLGAAVVSVVAAQHATDRTLAKNDEL